MKKQADMNDVQRVVIYTSKESVLITVTKDGVEYEYTAEVRVR